MTNRLRSWTWRILLIANVIAWVAIAVGVVTCARAEAGEFVERPPAAFRLPRMVIVHFVEDVQAACEAWGFNYAVTGCANPMANSIIVPLPCERRGFMADLLCHEIGHLFGWRHREPILIELPILPDAKPLS